MSEELQGSCLCGAVAFRVEPPFDYFGHCYCSRCRKKTGTAKATSLIVDAAQLKWAKGQEHVRRWDMPQVRSFATAVCVTCGTNLPHLTRSGREAIVPAGSIDSEIPMIPMASEHSESRPSWAESE